MLIIFFSAMLILLEGARRESHAVLALEYRFKLFKLRDDLRAHVTDHPELARGWLFKYLDSTITKFVSQLPGLSVWDLAALTVTHMKSREVEIHLKHLKREYAKPQNQMFKHVEIELMATISSYLSRKHTGLRFAFEVMRGCGHSVDLLKVWAAAFNRKRKESLAVAVVAPETSTLHDYCPA